MTAAHLLWCQSQRDLVWSQLTQRLNGEEEASWIVGHLLRHSPAIKQGVCQEAFNVLGKKKDDGEDVNKNRC